MSSDAARAEASARALGLERSYADFRQMAQAEAARPDGIRAVSIVTPNHLHAAAAVAFLDAGIHVICDKPLAATPDQARAIADAAEKYGVPMVKVTGGQRIDQGGVLAGAVQRGGVRQRARADRGAVTRGERGEQHDQ